MFKKFYIILPLFILLLISSFFIYFWLKHKHTPAFQTIHAELSAPQHLDGIVQPDHVFLLQYAASDGNLHKIHVKNTNTIVKGTPLVTYYDYSKVNLINALHKLSEKNLPTEQSYDLAIKITELQSQLYKTIKSPISGIVHLHKNNHLQKGYKILDIVSKTQHIQTRIPENLLPQFKLKQSIQLTNRVTQEHIKGTINHIDLQPIQPTPSSKLSSYIMTIKTKKTYPLGTHFNVIIEPAHIILPADVLLDENTVVLYKKHRFIKRKVNYDKINEKIIIKTGIFDGENIVRNPKMVL